MLVLAAGLAWGADHLAGSPVARRLAGSGGSNAAGDIVTDVVRRGAFRVAVTERGTLDSQKNAVLSNTVEGTTTILSIVPEGTRVEAGALVCELDSSALVEKEKQQQIAVTQSQADLKKAEENVEIQKRQNESDVSAARLALELAQLDLRKFREGESIQQVNEIKGEITVAEEELTRSVEIHEFGKRVAKKGYRSQNDLEADRIAVTKARIKLDVARDKLKVMQDYTARRTLKELEEKATESVRQLDRVERQGIAALAQFQADLAARKLTFSVETGKLEKYRRLIAACKLYAPQDGEVVYATDSSRSREPVVIEERATVFERQRIINLPDLDRMKVDARIHESKIRRIRPGLTVLIRIDAFPDEVFHGILESVSSVPVKGNWPNYDLKEYPAIVSIAAPTGDVPESEKRRLKPGLTAALEIVVTQRDDVLQTPIQSVVAVGEKHFAWVVADGRTERREIVGGDANDQTIEILDGLAEGDAVVLNPRTRFADELRQLEAEYGKIREQEQVDEAAGEAPPGPGVPAVPSGPSGPSSEPASGPGRAPRGGSPGDAGSEPRTAAASSDSPGAGSGASGRRDPAAFFAALDKNGDGKLAQDELPEPMRPAFARLDADSNGSIDATEWAQAPRSPGRGRAPTGGGPDAGGESAGAGGT